MHVPPLRLSLLAGVGLTLCHSAMLDVCLFKPLIPPQEPPRAQWGLTQPSRPRQSQGAPDGTVWAVLRMLRGSFAGQEGECQLCVADTEALLSSSLLSWGVALGCVFSDYRNGAGARARNSFAHMWYLLQQCCAGVLDVAGSVLSLPVFTFLLSK